MGRDAGVTLAAVQDAALGSASTAADAARRAGQARVERIIAEAGVEASAVVARRRDEAQRLADAEARERIAWARAEARAIVLRAQRTLLAEATAAARAAARRLVDDPRYESLLERLAADARARLPAAGPVQIVTAPSGGLVARAGSREIDYSLDAQVERALDALAGELDRLWR